VRRRIGTTAQEDEPKLNADGRKGTDALRFRRAPKMAGITSSSHGPTRSLIPRGIRRIAGFGLLALGLLLIAEASVTVLWKEPFTALSAHSAQKKLETKLDRIGVASPAGTDRLPALARRLEERSREGDPLGRVVIPRIGSRFVFVSGTQAGDLRKGPGHYVDTALPGERGTVGIAGHRTTYLAPFRNIDDLDRGDRIELRMPYGNFSYAVAGTKIVPPRDVSVLRHRSGDWLVLTACHPLYSAAKRIVVSARLIQKPS
jgi:sortase A